MKLQRVVDVVEAMRLERRMPAASRLAGRNASNKFPLLFEFGDNLAQRAPWKVVTNHHGSL
jgi:hypothetical protein